MAARRRIDTSEGMRALRSALQAGADRGTIATATRFLLEELAAIAPGNALEVRVPPFGATQCLPGPTHTRGTPPGVVETDPDTWIALAVGRLGWEQALESGAVAASGVRADLGGVLPLLRDPSRDDRSPSQPLTQ